VFPEAVTMRGPFGCWNPRRIEGSSRWSLHAEGRAGDIGVLEHWTTSSGWELACSLVSERVQLGVMRVIYDGHVWSTEHPAEWRQLQPSVNQHRDHVHVEQWWKNARMAPQVVQPQYVSALREARDKWAEASPTD
jgi:hypothetical protein